MPELPEVETVVRSIARLKGRRIVSAEFTCLRVLRGGDPDRMAASLAGRKITGIKRYGKFILASLDGAAQRLGVKTNHGIEIDDAQDKVVNFANADHGGGRKVGAAGCCGLSRTDTMGVAPAHQFAGKRRCGSTSLSNRSGGIP